MISETAMWHCCVLDMNKSTCEATSCIWDLACKYPVGLTWPDLFKA